jgi:DnaJ-class molecular chaperone
VPVGGDPDDVDEPLVRPVLVHLTREEARMGCRKHVNVDGQSVPVDVPAGANVHTYIDIDNLGYRDERTGMVGPLRVCFHVA